MRAALARATIPTGERFACGPIEVELHAGTPALRDKLAGTFELYTVRWRDPRPRIAVEAGFVDGPAAMGEGAVLRCGRMHVDRAGEDLVATCRSGAACRSSSGGARWVIDVPRASTTGEAMPEDIEDLAGLILTTAWRGLGLVPLHVGSVLRGGVCALLCAASGGGKTTLTTAMIREGWRTLGDDKLLLDLDLERRPRVAAMIDRFNLHPQSRRWFPELGDLTGLPRYSAWTDKRKVSAEAVWPGAVARRGCPTHLLRLERREDARGISVRPMPQAEILPTLLRQTVIPSHRAIAGPILAVVAAAAQRLEGLDLVIGKEAYATPGWSAPLVEALS
jgi:hypothetical protein